MACQFVRQRERERERPEGQSREESLPTLLPCESFVQQRQHLGDVELDILEIEILEVILLHLQQVIEFQVQLQEPPSTTLVMQTDDKRPRQWTLEHKEDISPPVLGDITASDHPFLLQLLVGELVRSQFLVLGGFAARLAFGLTADVVQIRLVRLQLTHQVGVVVPNGRKDLFQFLGLVEDLLLQGTQVHEFLLDLVAQQAKLVGAVNHPHLLQLAEELHRADTLAHHDRVVAEGGRCFGDAVEPQGPPCDDGVGGQRPQDLDKGGLGFHEQHLFLGDVQGRGQVVEGGLPAAEQRHGDGAVLLARHLRGRGAQFLQELLQVGMLIGRRQGAAVFLQQGVRDIHFVEGDLQLEIALGEGHVVVHFQTLVKVLHLTQVEHELVDALLVLLDEGVQLDHVGLLGVGGLVGEVLQHLGDQRQRAPRLVAGHGVDQHVRSRGDNGRVDEAQEEEASDQGTDGGILGLGVLAARQAADLLADPPDAVGGLVDGVDDGGQKAVGDVHEHLQARRDDGLHLLVLGGGFGGDGSLQIVGQGTGLVFDLAHHGLVDLQGVDLQVDVVQFDQGVDLVGQDLFQVALTGAPTGVGGHHARHGGVLAQQGREVRGVVELIGQHGLKHGQ